MLNPPKGKKKKIKNQKRKLTNKKTTATERFYKRQPHRKRHLEWIRNLTVTLYTTDQSKNEELIKNKNSRQVRLKLFTRPCFIMTLLQCFHVIYFHMHQHTVCNECTAVPAELNRCGVKLHSICIKTHSSHLLQSASLTCVMFASSDLQIGLISSNK